MGPSIPRKDDWPAAPCGRRDETSAIILQQGIGEKDQGVWIFAYKGISRKSEYSATRLSVTKQGGQMLAHKLSTHSRRRQSV
jgi:hypothetical protein